MLTTMKKVVHMGTVDININTLIKSKEIKYVVKMKKVKSVLKMMKMKLVLKTMTRADFENNKGCDGVKDSAD